LEKSKKEGGNLEKIGKGGKAAKEVF